MICYVSRESITLDPYLEWEEWGEWGCRGLCFVLHASITLDPYLEWEVWGCGGSGGEWFMLCIACINNSRPIPGVGEWMYGGEG